MVAAQPAMRPQSGWRVASVLLLAAWMASTHMTHGSRTGVAAAAGGATGALPRRALQQEPPRVRASSVAVTSSASGSSSKPFDTCVCVFDFDDTLRVGKNKDDVAKDANGIVQACKDNGWEIGVASANDNYKKLMSVLPRVDPNVFDKAFLDSTAFQFYYHNKTISLQNIIRFYDTVGECLMFFDDGEWNRKYAIALDVHFELVGDRSVGVTWGNYDNARKVLQQSCSCAPPSLRTYTPFSFEEPDRSFLSNVPQSKGGWQKDGGKNDTSSSSDAAFGGEEVDTKKKRRSRA